jgi:hypothetical protein
MSKSIKIAILFVLFALLMGGIAIAPSWFIDSNVGNIFIMVVSILLIIGFIAVLK